MTHTYEVVPTTVEHVLELSETMRTADQAEIWASGNYTPFEGLTQSIRLTEETMTGLVDGHVLCIFGVGKTTLTSPVGFPWMLSSVLVDSHIRPWARGSKMAFEHMTKAYNVKHLRNHIDARYTEAVRWLKWLGFTIHPAEPFGMEQLPFHLFTWDMPNV
jgi:hypothetical protein